MLSTDHPVGSNTGASSPQRPSEPTQITPFPLEVVTKALCWFPTIKIPVKVTSEVEFCSSSDERGARGANGSTLPPGATSWTSSTEGKGVKPIETDDAAMRVISVDKTGLAEDSGWDVAVGVSPPQPPTTTNTATGASQCLAACFNQVAETVKIRLELLSNNPSQDAGFHQRCQDPW